MIQRTAIGSPFRGEKTKSCKKIEKDDELLTVAVVIVA